MLDPTITLFGKIIQVNGDVVLEVEDDCRRHNEFYVNEFNSDVHREDEVYKELTEEQSMQNDDEPNGISLGETVDESTNATEMSEITDLTDKASNDKDKQLLKKPDKILPCPRCNSMDTKFCYYNNYNVNQPRHFCRKCQRYWTAGGNMRNVPVGAGRRKNKASAPRYCHMTVSDTDVAVNNSGTVLSFGSDYPIPDSRAAENGDDRSSGSTVTTNSMEDQSKRQQFNGFNNQMQTQMQMQCFQWPYMWNPAFPVPIYPHPYWNGAPVPWNGPWAPTQIRPGPTPNPPTSLGKRTREGEIISQPPTTTTKTTKSSKVLIPKTLRIDDPDEAAKSSIWTTLGIKKDKGDPNVRKGFFNSLQSKGEGRNEGEIETSAALFKANPVALCRSFNFQEKT